VWQTSRKRHQYGSTGFKVVYSGKFINGGADLFDMSEVGSIFLGCPVATSFVNRCLEPYWKLVPDFTTRDIETERWAVICSIRLN
jgi:hypothetical protein